MSMISDLVERLRSLARVTTDDSYGLLLVAAYTIENLLAMVRMKNPHGEWVTVNDILDVYICDQCGEIYQIQNIPMWHFCPNCGAKMNKGGDSE